MSTLAGPEEDHALAGRRAEQRAKDWIERYPPQITTAQRARMHWQARLTSHHPLDRDVPVTLSAVDTSRGAAIDKVRWNHEQMLVMVYRDQAQAVADLDRARGEYVFARHDPVSMRRLAACMEYRHGTKPDERTIGLATLSLDSTASVNEAVVALLAHKDLAAGYTKQESLL